MQLAHPSSWNLGWTFFLLHYNQVPTRLWREQPAIHTTISVSSFVIFVAENDQQFKLLHLGFKKWICASMYIVEQE